MKQIQIVHEQKCISYGTGVRGCIECIVGPDDASNALSDQTMHRMHCRTRRCIECIVGPDDAWDALSDQTMKTILQPASVQLVARKSYKAG
jgi:hypothetical protein